MKAFELKEILRTIPDDVEIDFELQIKIPEKQLKTMSYPWPYDYETLRFAGYDCSYSDKALKLLVEKSNPLAEGE